MKAATGITARLAGLFLAGLLFILPLFFLQQMLIDLAEKDEIHLGILAREKLLNDMESFQEALSPDKYIETALNDLNRHFRLKDFDNQQRELTFQPGTDPKLIDAGFIDKARAFLQQNYQMQPFLFLAADCDLQNHWLSTTRDFFPDEKTRARFAEAAMFGLAFVDADPINVLPDTPDLSQRKKEFIARYQHIDDNTHQIFAKFFVLHVSAFSNPALYQGQARTFYSKRFGHQRSFQIFHLLNQGFSPHEKLFGLYYCCFNNSDLLPTMVLKKAIQNQTAQARRHLLKRVVEQPFFHEEGGRLYYLAGFPSSFHTLVADFSVTNPETSRILLQFLQQHCLVTSIDAGAMISGYRQAARITGWLIRFLLIGLMALLVKSLSGFKMLRQLKLGGKLRAAVATAVTVPVIGFLVISMLIRSSSERLVIHNCQTRVRQHMQLLEKLVSENDPRLVMMLQEFKKFYADTYFAPNPDRQLIASLTEAYEKLKFANHSQFFDREARIQKFYGQKFYQGHYKEMIGLFRILMELGGVNYENRLIADFQRKNLFMSSYSDSYWNVYANSAVLARESLLTRNFLSMSALKRSCNQILAHPDTPFTPEAILFHEAGDTPIMRALLKQLWHKSAHLLSDYSQEQQIDYGLFLRGPTELREMQIPRSGPGRTSLRKLADRAVEKRTSGSAVTREQGKISISSWLYFDDVPVIIVAQAKIAEVSQHGSIYLLLPLGMLAYTVLAMGLLSSTLADALLGPVHTLTSFVRHIQAGKLDVRAEIAGRDELGELAGSFNLMSTGLCQREKMRRFVSDKLFSSLESPDSDRGRGKANLTILSSDIRGFTTISEQNSPEEIVNLLNDYFTCMETAITAHGGSIEKIVGDAIIAAFYEGNPDGSHAVRACKAAVEMRRRLAEFNANRRRLEKFIIDTGIGIATGEAVLGFAGRAGRRREFFLIGDVIQRAEMLESMTKSGTMSRIFVDRPTFELSGGTIGFCQKPSEIGATFYREIADDC